MDFTFQLNYSDGRQDTLHVADRSDIDPSTLNSSEKGRPWTRLDHQQCSICPFDTAEIRYCPAAYNLQDVLTNCSGMVSHEKVTFVKHSGEDQVSVETTVQRALFTVIATAAINSACPILNSRRWVLNYYTMITSPENIFYLSISSYLVKQYFLSTIPSDADFELKCHVAYVNEMYQIFTSLVERFRNRSEGDGNDNAFVLLVMTTSLMKTDREKMLADLKKSIGL